jgi:hypothetical protein
LDGNGKSAMVVGDCLALIYPKDRTVSDGTLSPQVECPVCGLVE